MMVKLKQNDTGYTFTYPIVDDTNEPVNLTGSTLVFNVGNGSQLIISNPATIVDAVNGIVSYTFTDKDSLNIGNFIGEFAVTDSTGNLLHYPRTGYLVVSIQADVDVNQSNISIDAIAAREGDFTNKLNQILAQSSSLPEIIDARGTFTTLGLRLNNSDAQLGNPTNLQTTDKSSLVNAINENVAQLADIVIDVKNFGAKGDGATDDTAAIQNAIDYLNNQNFGSTKGGKILLPSGVYIVVGIKLYSYIHLIGSGFESTILKLKDGSNKDVIFSESTYSLEGSGSIAGEHQFGIHNLAIDGNRANNTAGRGIRVYGYDYTIEHVRIRNCYEKGFSSEWGANGTPAPNNNMESNVYDLKVSLCGAEGIDFAGPHDTQFVNCIVNNCNQNNWGAAGFHTRGQGLVVLTNVHVWGTEHDSAYKLEATAHLVNCQGEGAKSNVVILANDCTVIGGHYFGFNAGDVGFVIGSNTVNVAGTLINTKVTNCQGGIINFVNEGSGHYIFKAYNQNAYANANGIVGTLNLKSYLNIVDTASNGAQLLNLPSGSVIKVGYDVLNYPSDTKTDLSTLATAGVINSLQVVDGGYYYVTGTNAVTINNIDETNVANKKAKIYFIVEGNSTASITIKSTSNILTPNEVDYVISKANNLGDKLVTFTKPLSWSPEFRLS